MCRLDERNMEGRKVECGELFFIPGTNLSVRQSSHALLLTVNTVGDTLKAVRHSKREDGVYGFQLGAEWT